MANNPQLESYLEALDKALGPVPISARADIITEIKSHIMEAQERDPNATLGGILSSIGEPQTVANRYLLERGLKPGRAARAPVVKWLTVGFLGTLGILCLTFIMVLWRFTPLISVDEKTDHVVLLGGAIDVHGDTGNVKIGSATFSDRDESKSITGSEEIDPKKIKKVQIPFANGKISMKSSTDGRLHWSCRINKNAPPTNTRRDAGIFTFDFGSSASIKCEFEIPEKIKSSIQGNNGKIAVEKMLSDLDVNLINGKLSFQPAPDTHYRYNLSVKRGVIGDFDSSTDPKAFVINVEMQNGKISKEESEDSEE